MSEVHIGELLEHGPAPFNFVKGNSINYFMRLEGANNGKPLWGQLLGPALENSSSRPQIGDVVRAEVLSRKPVKVKEPIRDKAGNVIGTREKSSQLATWKVDVYEPPLARAPAGPTDDGAKVTPKDKGRNVPAERGALVVKTAGEIAKRLWNRMSGRVEPTNATPEPPTEPIAPKQTASQPSKADIAEMLQKARPEINERLRALRAAAARPGQGPKEIHGEIYSGLVPGAGEYRSTDEGIKGSIPTWATRGEDVARRAAEMFDGKEDKLRGAAHDTVIEGVATRYIDSVKLRPMLYANLTVSKIDAEKAAERAGVRLDMFGMDRERLSEATSAAIRNDFMLLRKLMDDHAAPMLTASRSESISNSVWAASDAAGQSQHAPTVAGRGGVRDSNATLGLGQSRGSSSQTQRPVTIGRRAVTGAPVADGVPSRRPSRAYAP
jgi:hypothetical protein